MAAKSIWRKQEILIPSSLSPCIKNHCYFIVLLIYYCININILNQLSFLYFQLHFHFSYIVINFVMCFRHFIIICFILFIYLVLIKTEISLSLSCNISIFLQLYFNYWKQNVIVLVYGNHILRNLTSMVIRRLYSLRTNLQSISLMRNTVIIRNCSFIANSY